MTISNVLLVVAVLAGEASADEIRIPVVKDSRLQLTLLAHEPEIFTPTALAADSQGRLYVVESHTHSRGPQYKGPASDRILVFEDVDRNGQLDPPRVYADGLRNALSMAFSRDGELYVVQMKSVVALRDADQDGRCETKKTVLTIDTTNNNHHGVFLALAFDQQNQLYVSLGNIGGSSYSIQGTDGSVVSGRGDTGLMVRSQADGASLARFAHGFWNACDLRFDAAGRLLATDNDPDARGPNRVLHVIQGGEYGFKSRFGGSGLHPYCAWNGEVPGTLPMLAGVGEAPVGLLDCKSSSLPPDYADDLLVCVWGTNEVVRVRTRRYGASLKGSVEPLISGDANFRPTGIVATADGACYIADWADRKYPVHGKGRIWRLAAKPHVKVLRPRLPSASADVDPSEAQLTQLRGADTLGSFDRLVDAATQSDPFVASTAVTSLTQGVFHNRVARLLEDESAPRRTVGLLALGKAGVDLETSRLRKLLYDDDSQIRKLAMIRIGETRRQELADDVKQSISVQAESADLFETFLATLQLLSAVEGQKRPEQGANDLLGLKVYQEMIRSVLADDRQPPATRAMAMRYLTDVDRAEIVHLLSRLVQSNDPVLSSEALRTLAAAREKSVAQLFVTLARDTRTVPALRCDAIMALVASETRNPEELLTFVNDPNPQVALTAVRALTPRADQESVRHAFQSAIGTIASDPEADGRSDQLRFALKLEATDRPRTDDQWKTALLARGDPEAGRRVFFDQRVGCSKCHSIDGRGGRIGPNLSNIAAAKSRDQIQSSILNPSQEKSPDYQGYVVRMNDGRIYRGTQFHFRGESAELLVESGQQVRFALRDTDEYRALDESLMPERLEETMSVSELRDLLDYLGTLRPPSR